MLGSEPSTAQRFATNLDVNRQRLWQREPNKKQVKSAEGQGEQSRRLVEDTFSHFGADGKVGAQQRPHGEAQREGNADHGLETRDRCLHEVGIQLNIKTFPDKITAYHSPVPCFGARQVCYNGSAEANVALADSSNDSEQKEHAEALGNRPHGVRGHEAELETHNPHISTEQNLDLCSAILQRHRDVTQQHFIKLVLLTVVRMSSGRLPCRSDKAPVTGEARNCSSENSEPIRPEESERRISGSLGMTRTNRRGEHGCERPIIPPNSTLLYFFSRGIPTASRKRSTALCRA